MSTEEPTDEYDSYFTDDEDRRRLRERLEGLLPNVIRRTVSTGVGAKQYTEDVIRGAIGEIKLPREAVLYLFDVADTTKREVVRVAAREFREFLDSAKFNEEMAKLLTQLSFEIRTEIRFIPNDQALKPSVQTEAKVRTASGKTVDAAPGTTETINDAVRSNATELVEMLLMRVLGGKLGDDVDDPDAEPEASAEAEAEDAAGADEPDEKPKKRRRRKKDEDEEGS